MIRIIYKDRNFAVIEKPVGILSEGDPAGEPNALTLAAEALKASGERPELWQVHRLDRVVGGVMLFARTPKSAAELSRLVAEGKIQKTYLAVTEGVPQAGAGTMKDFLRRDPAAMKSFVAPPSARGAKYAELSYLVRARRETESGARALVEIELKTGRFHQIRAQLSSRSLPLVGDKKYASRDLAARTPALFSHRLEFSLGGKKYSFSAFPPLDQYPWSLFSEGDYKQNERDSER